MKKLLPTCSLVAVALLLLHPPSFGSRATARETARCENVLILIADDLGIDRVRAYGYTNSQGMLIAPNTSNIDQLAAEGILFRNAWAAPACSTSRASALTGRYPNRVGVGAAISSNGSGDTGLRDDYDTIADLLPVPYRRAVLGKWHVAGPGSLGALTQGIDHAPRCGFEVHVGTFANLVGSQTYFDWLLLQSSILNLPATSETWVNGQYATTYTTDSAIRTINNFDDQPWFLLVSFNAPHTPYHVPPAALIQTPGLDTTQNLGKGKAMIEALDTEIGRLLASISPDVRAHTTVIFYGDNGTQFNLVQPPFSGGKSKGTVYNGGVHVPMIVSSPLIPPQHVGAECAALIDVTDLLPTVLEVVGVSAPTTIDGVSMVPYLQDPSTASQRAWIYAEKFKPNFVPAAGQTIGDQTLTQHHQAVRDARYKLIRQWGTASETFLMFDLATDYFETQNLLDAQNQPPPSLQTTYNALRSVLTRMAQ